MTDSPVKAYRKKHGLTLEGFGSMFVPPVHKTTVMRWELRQVPSTRVLDVERKTGIPRHVTRPDLYPADSRQ